MNGGNFVDRQSIVREIWGKGDTILFIFGGAAAEFALNKAVDWLYFTGRLPADPLGRLFSTVSYARAIIFSDHASAIKAINSINHIHAAVEEKRGAKIPEWAYRDVLFMLIDYSIRAFEILERPLNLAEKQEVLDVFIRVGERMKLESLPQNFGAWEEMRTQHLQQDLKYSEFTADLYKRYREQLGEVRYRLLLETQQLMTPPVVQKLLGFRGKTPLRLLLPIYKLSRSFYLDRFLKSLLLPPAYKQEIKALDMQ